MPKGQQLGEYAGRSVTEKAVVKEVRSSGEMERDGGETEREKRNRLKRGGNCRPSVTRSSKTNQGVGCKPPRNGRKTGRAERETEGKIISRVKKGWCGGS